MILLSTAWDKRNALLAGLLLVGWAVFFQAIVAHAAPPDGSSPRNLVQIEEIRLEGLQVWSPRNARSLIEQAGIRAGETMVRSEFERRVNNAIAQLLAEGLFSDIQVRREGEIVVFEFEEYPRITSIEFKGNSAYDAEKLSDVILLQEDEPATSDQIESSRRELESFYRENGYRHASVESELVESPEGTARVVFRIQERRQNVVNNVYLEYVGGKNPLAQLTQNWSIKWIMPLTEGRPYSSKNLQKAQQAIIQWYHKRGRLEVEVTPDAVRNLREGGVDVTFRIKEGPVYDLGSVRFVNNTLFSDTQLKNMLRVQPGEVFDKLRIFQDLKDIEKRYHDRGYVDATVFDSSRFRLGLNKKKQTADMVVRIDEGQPYYVEQIEIHGNRVTYDQVIRREISLQEGDLLDGEKKRNSLRRLRQLGFFKEVKMNVDPGTRENTKIVRVRVKAAKTGQLQFGGGYSSSSGLVGQFRVTKDNFSLYDWNQGFSGRGQTLQTSLEVGSRRTNFQVSWDDPWFNDDLDEPGSPAVPVSFGFTAFNVKFDRFGDFSEERTGGSLRFGREFGYALSNRVQVSYSFHSTEVNNLLDDGFVDDDVPLDLINEARASGDTDSFDRSIGSLGFTLQRDLRDNQIFPSSGYFLSASTELAGEFFGGNSNFYSPHLEARFYIPFWGPTFWGIRANYRTIDTWENDPTKGIPSFQRFFLGGTQTIRGYEFRDIAIYNSSGQKVSGGNSAAYANLEFRLDMVENTMQMYLFGDVGNVYRDAWDINTSNLKQSAGVGMRVRSPMGPINLSWASRLEETYPGADDTGETQFDFTIGRGF